MATQCGTRNGYQLHIQRHEVACDPCLVATARYSQCLRIRSGRQVDLRVSLAVLRTLLASDDPADGWRGLVDHLGGDLVDAILAGGA